ncbi:g10252 [Coccomyxa elongata]
MPQWAPTMQSAPVSPAVAFTPSHMSQGWQMQPHPATFQWPQSPQPIGPSGNGFGGYPHHSPHPSTMQHMMAPPGPTAGSYLVLMQPPPPPVHVPVMSRPATSPAPLGILRHSPEHSDRGSQSPSPASREAGSSSRGMNLAFLSALHHNHRAIGNAMQQLTAADPGMPEQLQAAVAELQHLMECHGVFSGPAGKSLDKTSLKSSWSPKSPADASKVICTGDTADRSHREPASFNVLGQSMQWSGGRVPILNARARRTLKRALKRAVAELSAAGVHLTSTLRPLPYSGRDALADRNNGPHDAASVTGADKGKSSLECESLGSSSPSAKTPRQSSPHLCEKCGTQSMAVTTAVAPHDSPDGSAGSELSDSNSDINGLPEEDVTADGANARHRHAESGAGTVRALSGKPGKREVQLPKIRITLNAARRLPKPIMVDSEGEELHREGE